MHFFPIILYFLPLISSENLDNSIQAVCQNHPSSFCSDYQELRRRARDTNISNATLTNATSSDDGISAQNSTIIEDDDGNPLTADQIREELRKIIQEENAKQQMQASQPDDPACSKLRQEYDGVCFSTPPLAAFQETREFCMAFVKNCRHSLLTNIFTNFKNFRIDYTTYCKRHRERFRYVCPDPLRFSTFAQDAVEFCLRYNDRCPNEEVPSEAVQFKRKDSDHIYTREIQFWCTRTKRTAYNYCTDPDLLKVPKYMQFCGLYKIVCIDVHRKVIYG